MSESDQAASIAKPPSAEGEKLELEVEAALLTSERPVAASKLSEALGGVGAKAIHQAIDRLNQFYEHSRRSFRIEALAGGWQIMTLPQFGGVLSALHKSSSATRLSAAALETLAIIAYKQPIVRADIEAIRGVACGEVVRTLMDRHLVKIVGRAEELGRPMLYGTSKTFLQVFGLAGLNELPKIEELQLIKEEQAPAEPAKEPDDAHAIMSNDE